MEHRGAILFLAALWPGYQRWPVLVRRMCHVHLRTIVLIAGCCTFLAAT